MRSSEHFADFGPEEDLSMASLLIHPNSSARYEAIGPGANRSLVTLCKCFRLAVLPKQWIAVAKNPQKVKGAMMRILLINPTIRENKVPYVFPIGIGIIAEILRNEGHEVLVYDQNGLRTPNDELCRAVAEYKPVEVVALGGSSRFTAI
jgi:hypothetical protein